MVFSFAEIPMFCLSNFESQCVGWNPSACIPYVPNSPNFSNLRKERVFSSAKKGMCNSCGKSNATSQRSPSHFALTHHPHGSLWYLSMAGWLPHYPPAFRDRFLPHAPVLGDRSKKVTTWFCDTKWVEFWIFKRLDSIWHCVGYTYFDPYSTCPFYGCLPKLRI